MVEDEERLERMNITAMVTELFIAECRAQDLLLAPNSKWVHQELKREFKLMFHHLRKIVSIMQSKYKDEEVLEQGEMANSLEKINNLFVLASKEQREYMIDFFLNYLENGKEDRRT